MSAQEQLVGLYEKFEGLVDKLPGGLQKPILRELAPIKGVFLEQRPARIAITGGGEGVTVPEWLNGLGAGPVKPGASIQGWRSYRVEGLGSVEIFDARDGAIIDDTADLRAEMTGLPTEADDLAEALPPAAKLEFARLTHASETQRKLASASLKSFTAICSVIGVQPIPLADLPVLTALQTLMVGMIVHVSGRKFSPRLAAEFAGTLGISFGIGFAFRSVSRQLLKFIPLWGNAISGAVAGAGTYAIGRAAIAYFIDGAPRSEAKRLYQETAKQLGETSEPKAS